MERITLKDKLASGWGIVVEAFGDVVRSSGWIVKTLQIGLLSLVPIFGAIVLNGYLFGWAREAAWGQKRPLPARLFGNEDGKLYWRGWYAFLISLVYGLLLSFVYVALVAASQAFFPTAGEQTIALDLYAYAQQRMGIHPALFAVYYAVSLVLSPFVLVSTMRMSIYGSLGAGLQFGRVLAMVRKGLVGIAVIVVATTVVQEAVSALIDPLSKTALSMSFDALGALGTLAGMFAGLVVLAFVNMVSVRAVGLWTRQFDVPRWRGSVDPMPFELAEGDATADGK